MCEQRQQQHLPTGGLVVEAVEEHDGTAGVMLQPVACDTRRVKRQVKCRSPVLLDLLIAFVRECNHRPKRFALVHQMERIVHLPQSSALPSPEPAPGSPVCAVC